MCSHVEVFEHVTWRAGSHFLSWTAAGMRCMAANFPRREKSTKSRRPRPATHRHASNQENNRRLAISLDDTFRPWRPRLPNQRRACCPSMRSGDTKSATHIMVHRVALPIHATLPGLRRDSQWVFPSARTWSPAPEATGGEIYYDVRHASGASSRRGHHGQSDHPPSTRRVILCVWGGGIR